MDAEVQTGYWQYVAPVDGYVEKVIVSPHQAATSGTVGLQWKNQSGNISTEVDGTISATAGVPTTYTFGSSYGFSGDDRLNLLVDRGAIPNPRDLYDFSPLFWQKDLESVKYLLQYNPITNNNIYNAKDWRPGHYYNKMFIEGGYDPYSENNISITPIFLQKEISSSQIFFASLTAISKILSLLTPEIFFIILSTAHLRLIAVGLELIKSSDDFCKND